jgi:hypothetical protein
MEVAGSWTERRSSLGGIVNLGFFLMPSFLRSAWQRKPLHITNRERFGIGRRLKDIDRGFWAVAKERMEDLLANLPWDSLLPLPRKLRVELVELRAKGAFSGAYGEAIIRAMVM